jgi:hypothetical protein
MSRILKFSSPALLLLMVLCLATKARADMVLLTAAGDTTTSPTFNRPGDATPPNPKDGNAPPYTPNSLSGLNTRYSVITFNVSIGGNYSLTALSDFDNFLLLYSGGFDPSSPLTNVRLAIDNVDGEKTYAAFSAALVPGVDYFAVVTGSGPGDFGAFTLQFYGPGSINFGAPPTPTPEPATLALLVTGLSGAGAAIRRKRRGRAAQMREASPAEGTTGPGGGDITSEPEMSAKSRSNASIACGKP